jgi:hypothetical protein
VPTFCAAWGSSRKKRFGQLSLREWCADSLFGYTFCADPKGYSEVAMLIELQPVANVEDARAKRGAPFEVALKS